MNVHEIAPGVFRISTFVPEFNLQFNQFLIKDEEPLLFHTGMKGMFPDVYQAVSKLIDPATLRWIGFSHFESDECGSLNEWLEAAPDAEPVCSLVGAMVSVNDFAVRPARAMADDEILETGQNRFRFLRTPHVPHCWEAGLLFEESNGTLFCSDLLTHEGDVEPQTSNDVVGRFEEGLVAAEAGPFANAYPYSENTDRIFEKLAGLKPKTLAIMHGSTYSGDGESILHDTSRVMRKILAPEQGQAA